MIILDFDHTLFDTDSFKKYRALCLLHAGVNEKDYEASIRLFDNELYSDMSHAHALSSLGYDEMKMMQVFQEITEHESKKFLFEDAIHFIQSLKTDHERLILLSLGDIEFQTKKIESSGIWDLFDEVKIVEKSKEDEVCRIVRQDEQTWIINDRIDETEKMLLQVKLSRCVLKINNNITKEDYIKSGLPHFATLQEILTYVRSKKRQ